MDHIAMPDSKVNSALWSEGNDRISTALLSSALEFDVAIIGGGFSGLWSALHLIQSRPELRIGIFEARDLGFGASGRNGGWVSTDYPVSMATLLKRHGAARSDLLFQKLCESVDEIGRYAQDFAPLSKFVKSGSLSFARNRAQLERLEASRDDRSEFLNATELRERIRVEGAIGAVFNPDSGTIQPYQLLIGLARRLQRLGISIFTGAQASVVPDGLLVGSHLVKAETIIQATESYGNAGRDFIPLYSLMVATEPLPDSFWSEVGNSERFTFAEYSHLVNYAQRTPDNRLAIGGRGATYPFRSRLSDEKEQTVRVHEHIRSLAKSWFPALSGFEFTHSWGGAVAITRDWEPYVIWDRTRRFGRIGGYAGDGVTMSYLAAKALASEILDLSDSSRDLHFVGRKIRRWEPEPLRYIAVNSLVKLSDIADREEAITGRPSKLNRIIAPLILR